MLNFLRRFTELGRGQNEKPSAAATVRFSLKPHKVFLFNAETEERIYFEV